MNFDLTDEQTMLRDAAARFVREQHAFEHRRKLLAQGEGWSPAHWRRYAEFGWLGLCVDEAHGGLGCSMLEMALVMEQLGAAMAIDPIVASAVVAPSLLQASGRADLCDRWLSGIVAGEVVLTLAHEEAGHAGTGGLPSLRARQEGEGYVLHGSKTLVQAGGFAHRVILTARIEGQGDDALGLFLVDRRAPGVSAMAYALVDGRGCADLAFDGVRCTRDDLLLSGAAARAALDAALDRARVASLAEAVGGIEACMATTADYIKSRVQFGQSLSKFQALQHLMAEVFVDAQDARSSLYRALAHLEAAPPQRQRAVASAQLMVTGAGRRATATGVQLHGGYGLTDEYAVSHHFRQMLVLERLWGDARDALDRMDTPQ